MKTSVYTAIFCLLAASSAPATAQDDADNPPAAQPGPAYPAGAEQDDADPIIVIADPDAPQRKVSVGSRLPRSAPFAGTGKATNVGTPGLVPQSGMSPHAAMRTIKKRDCISDDEQLGKWVVCALATGDEFFAAGDLAGALSLYRQVAYSADNSMHERHVASEKIYAAARETQDPGLREEGLNAMLATGRLSPGQQRSARRSLVAIALSQKDDDKAIRYLEDVVAHDPEDARSLANLALVHHRNKSGDPQAIMARAIYLREAKGHTVPASWRAFAAPN